jgi:hypothetical protein
MGADPNRDDVSNDTLVRSASLEALVDPLQIDRAFGMLEECFALRCSTNSNAQSLLLTVRPADPLDKFVSDAKTVEIRCEATFTMSPDARNTVVATVGAALACKLLEVLGWRVELRDDASTRRLSIFVPLVETTSARNGSPPHDVRGGGTCLNA